MSSSDGSSGSSDRAPAKPDWSVPAEDLVSGTAGAVVGVAVVPILGPAAAPFAAVGAASVVKVAGQMLRKFVGERFVSRAERFENEVFRALGEEPDKIGEHLEDPRFQEVVFQNYRRAIDAIDPVVLPALARLTAMYRGREPDTFFRAAGRLLQDLSADELIALRELLSVCQQVDVQTISVVSWHTTRWELRFGEPNSKAKTTLSCVRHPFTVSVLGRLERVGLLADVDHDRHGRDLHMVGDSQINRATVDQLLSLVDPIEVHVFQAGYPQRA